MKYFVCATIDCGINSWKTLRLGQHAGAGAVGVAAVMAKLNNADFGFNCSQLTKINKPVNHSLNEHSIEHYSHSNEWKWNAI